MTGYFTGLLICTLLCADLLSQLIYHLVKSNDVIVPHNARWFFVHAVANALICWSGYEDLVFCIENTSYCALSPWTQWSRATYNIAVLSHLYHIFVFFPHLTGSEWIHHLVMLLFAAPLAFLYPSRVSTVGLCFLSGYPGLVDYSLLWLVKLGLVSSYIERRVYVWINTWIRSPGCLFACFLSLPALRNTKGLEFYCVLGQVMIVFWNGQYYAMKTCSDYWKRRSIQGKDKTKSARANNKNRTRNT